ncbi:hypothetical protein [Leucobacter ruminantium]|uniref:Transmembrane protein n=1 Tax=Leucobacter ruminantium TaxID=1289170 RepID=A0A939LXH4_9MICO|nr:hypothetical protein [Leucobacter ruminantium]MBO1804748.1 hypothetical protein [Leucobacter ruminantium]
MSIDDPRYTQRERRAGRRYTREFGAAIVLWLALFLGLPALWPVEPGGGPALLQALLPVLPLLWAAVAIARHVASTDEMQRQLLFRSFGFGFAAASLAAVVLTMLWGQGFRPPVPTMWTFLAGMVGWSLALAVSFGRR